MPILVVEAASDVTRRRDRMQKRSFDTEIRIPEYWMVDGADRTVRIVRPGQDDVVTREALRWHPAAAEAPLDIALVDIFGPDRAV